MNRVGILNPSHSPIQVVIGGLVGALPHRVGPAQLVASMARATGWMAQAWPVWLGYQPDLSKYPQRALRFGCRSGGFIFLALPILAPWGFFLLNLGSTAPNYHRMPPMRSSKAPPNQKNRGQVLPNPSEPSLRA